MTEYSPGFGYILPFICLFPLILFVCDFRHWILKVYDIYLNYHVKREHQERENACHKKVFVSEDTQGPFMILDGYKFYLVAMKAKPLKGVLIGDNFYTTNPADVLKKIVDRNF